MLKPNKTLLLVAHIDIVTLKLCQQPKYSKLSLHTLSWMAYKPLEEDLALKWPDS